MRAILTLGLAIAGCSAPARTPSDGESCAAVAEHLVVLAERDNVAAAGPELATGIRSETLRQCEDTPWTAARRDCLVAARTQDATLACPAQ